MQCSESRFEVFDFRLCPSSSSRVADGFKVSCGTHTSMSVHPIHNSPKNMALEAQQDPGTTAILDISSDQNTTPKPFEVVKRYDPRCGWTLNRLASSTGFLCHRCKKQKKAKLIAVQHNRWDKLCCNACYGLLLSKQ